MSYAAANRPISCPQPFGRPASHTGGSYEWWYCTFGPGAPGSPLALGATADVPSGGVMQSKLGWTYQITPDDLLWLARAAEAEGGGRPDATIWTMAQDLALHRGESFTSLIRSYSQPVNPIWSSASTPQCQRSPAVCTPAKIAHRLDVQSKPWSAIGQSVRDKVTAFAQAQLPNPVPRAVEFANAPVSRSFIANHPGSFVLYKSRLIGDANWYIVTSATSGWPADQVTVTYQGTISTIKPATVPSDTGLIAAVAVGSVALLGGGGYVYWRRRRSHGRRH